MHDHLLDRLAATPRNAAQLVAELDDAAMDAVIAGDWPARTILAHLRDDEYLCMRPALERMLAEDDPSVHFMDGGDWEPNRNRSHDRKEVLLADFALQRQATLNILRMLRPHEWERRGRRGGGASFTIAQLVEEWAGHDAEHIAQLERACGETLAHVLERRARMAE